MKEQIKQNIIDTLSYFDLFNYPVTLEQIHLFLHYNSTSKRAILECLNDLPVIEKKYGFYFFSGREKIAIKRRLCEKENKRKILIAANYCSLLGLVPGVKMIAVTGSVAMENASKNDDIDLFIVTRKNMLWVTRLMVILLTRMLGVKRNYKEKANKDKLCLNMFLDESNIKFSKKNLYTAHEILQMKVYYDGYRVLETLINKNLWIRDYFPNLIVKRKSGRVKKKWFEFIFFSEKLLKVLNLFAFIMQYIYMRQKITKEKISLSVAFFHPNSSDKFILNEHKKRSRKYLNLSLSSRESSQLEPSGFFTGKSKSN